MPKKIGLTQCVEVLHDRNERRDCLDQAWTPLLQGCGYILVPLPNIVAGLPQIIREYGLDGLILTGGNDLSHLEGAVNTASERDRFEHGLLEAAGELSLPLLGVCRGLQMMIAHYGGRLSRIEGHVTSRHGLIVRDPRLMTLTDRDEVNSFHDFAADPERVGKELTVLATAPDGSVEAVRHVRHPQYGIMWHPERDPHDPRDAELLSEIFG